MKTLHPLVKFNVIFLCSQVSDPVALAEMLVNATGNSESYSELDFAIASLIIEQVASNEEIRSNTMV